MQELEFIIFLCYLQIIITAQRYITRKKTHRKNKLHKKWGKRKCAFIKLSTDRYEIHMLHKKKYITKLIASK